MSTVIIHMPKYEAKSRQAKPAHTYVNGKSGVLYVSVAIDLVSSTCNTQLHTYMITWKGQSSYVSVN